MSYLFVYTDTSVTKTDSDYCIVYIFNNYNNYFFFFFFCLEPAKEHSVVFLNKGCVSVKDQIIVLLIHFINCYYHKALVRLH